LFTSERLNPVYSVNFFFITNFEPVYFWGANVLKVIERTKPFPNETRPLI
jgi:hypothetical protein